MRSARTSRHEAFELSKSRPTTWSVDIAVVQTPNLRGSRVQMSDRAVRERASNRKVTNMQKQSGKDVSKRADQIKKILHEIEDQKKMFEKKGMSFTGLDEEQLRAKLGRARSPMIVAQGWSGSVAPGGTLNYSVSIRNPDPAAWVWLFGHVFVGPANMVPSIGEGLDAIDSRFARLTLPAFPGLSLAANESTSLSYSIPIPTGIAATNYQGNTFLYQADWHDAGDYLDRSTFVFGVT